MADESWGIGLALGVQTDLGVQNAVIAALGGALVVADGIILGDRDSGIGNSGIIIPNFERIQRAVADVSGSFTKQATTFERVDPVGFSITIQLKGNGATSTPAAGEAKPDPGIDAAFQAAGLVGADGASPLYEYTPRILASSPTTRYVTAKLWVADLSFVLSDAVCESAVFTTTPGGVTLVTLNFQVGAHDPAADFADGVTLPTFAYGNQASLSAPSAKGVGFTWGTAVSPDHGQNAFQLSIDQTITEEDDTNQTTGKRKVVDDRTFAVDGRVFMADVDSDFEYQKAVGTLAPTEDQVWQIGTIAGASDIINAVKMEINNVELDTVSYDKAGTATIVEFAGKATGTAAGNEFKLTFN